MESKNVINPSVIYIGPYGEWCNENTWSNSERVTTYIKSADNFETALSALIEHHGADALTSLAAVMRHYGLEFQTVDGLTIAYSDAGIVFDMDKSNITANDIEPEK